MERRCGPRGGRGIYTREELLRLAHQRFPNTPLSELRRLGKRELCDRLGIVFRESRADDLPQPVTQDKVCSSRRSHQFPNRYTREELVVLAKRRRPTLSRGALRRMRIHDLCRHARLVYHAIEPRERPLPTPIEPFPERHADGHEDASQERQPSTCRTRGVKTLMAHQADLMDRFDRRRGIIAVHATGSGKTLSAVIASQCFLERHPRGHVLILTPASLVSNFEKELDAFGPALKHRDRYSIMSYQSFFVKKKSARHRHDPRIDCRKALLIVDEAHNFRTEYKKVGKRYQGLMTRQVLRCAEEAAKVLLLTATPIVNRIEDIVPLLNMIRDDPQNPNTLLSTKTFQNRAHDVDFLRDHLEGRFHFFQPADDIHRTVYPATGEELVFLTMEPEYLRRYQEIEEELATDDRLHLFGDVNLKKFFNGIRRATNTLDRETARESISPKIRWVLDFLTALPPDHKVIIFSQFLDMGSQAIFQRLPAAVRPHVGFITGQIPRRERQGIVNAFNAGQLRYLFLSKAGGEGLDLKGTRHIIIIEPSWNLAAEHQVIGRGVRFHSHSHLPYEDRHVQIHRLLNIKPRDEQRLRQILDEGFTNHPEGGLLSADLMLHNIQKRKQESIDHYLGILRAQQ